VRGRRGRRGRRRRRSRVGRSLRVDVRVVPWKRLLLARTPDAPAGRAGGDITIPHRAAPRTCLGSLLGAAGRSRVRSFHRRLLPPCGHASIVGARLRPVKVPIGPRVPAGSAISPGRSPMRLPTASSTCTGLDLTSTSSTVERQHPGRWDRPRLISSPSTRTRSSRRSTTSASRVGLARRRAAHPGALSPRMVSHLQGPAARHRRRPAALLGGDQFKRCLRRAGLRARNFHQTRTKRRRCCWP
jgi:hypothetical protein